MNSFKLLMKSPAFWTALFTAVGLVVLKYLNFPEDLWNAVLGVLTVVVAILTADGAVKSYARAQKDMLIEIRKEQEQNLALKGKG